jgi:ribosomal-protein-serine acetyltransferase
MKRFHHFRQGMFSYQIDENLRLEPPELRHAEAAAKVVQENLAHLKPWMPWAVDDYSIEHAKIWIEKAADAYAKDGTFGSVVVLNDEIIGGIGIHDLDKINRHTSIGYWVDYRQQGKGIVTRCCRVLIDYLFDTMDLNRVQINCNVDNTRSRAIPERLGFKLEGILRQTEFLNGKFSDWAVYGLLKSEWQHANGI